MRVMNEISIAQLEPAYAALLSWITELEQAYDQRRCFKKHYQGSLNPSKLMPRISYSEDRYQQGCCGIIHLVDAAVELGSARGSLSYLG
jgi:hypothetical protein